MTAPECSLCIEAEEKLHQALEGIDYQLEHSDITESFDLKKTYGFRIPVLVLQSESGDSELSWPFEVSDVRAFALGNNR